VPLRVISWIVRRLSALARSRRQAARLQFLQRQFPVVRSMRAMPSRLMKLKHHLLTLLFASLKLGNLKFWLTF